MRTTMRISADKLAGSGWADVDAANDVLDALGALGVDAHYAELAMQQGPHAVASLVEHRSQKDEAWAQKARALIAQAASPGALQPASGNAGRVKVRVLTGQVELPSATTSEPIRFYLANEKFGEMANFSKHRFAVRLADGRKLVSHTAEHLFQALKFWTTDPDYARAILKSKNPKNAAKMGRNRDRPMRKDWEDIKDDVMRVAVAHKFTQHGALGAMLKSTGSAPIIEHAPHDTYWGNGFELGGTGKNMLGVILEEVRAALLDDAKTGGTAAIDAYIHSAMVGAKLREPSDL